MSHYPITLRVLVLTLANQSNSCVFGGFVHPRRLIIPPGSPLKSRVRQSKPLTPVHNRVKEPEREGTWTVRMDYPCGSPPGKFEGILYVKTLTGKTVSIQCQWEMTIMELKKEIHRMEGVPVDYQRIVFGDSWGSHTLAKDDADIIGNYVNTYGTTVH